MNEIQKYLDQIPQEQKEAFNKLRQTILNNLPKGFEEQLICGLSYVVPHSLYPSGYHCSPEDPLPFVNIMPRKSSINFGHMGMYADPNLSKWFQEQYPKHCKYKLDMGKSCVRFKRLEDIPYDLIAELMTKMTVHQWIDLYELKYRK